MSEDQTHPRPSTFNWKDAPLRDWLLREPESQLQYRQRADLRDTLGPEHRTVEHGGETWAVWDDPLYVLYLHGSGEVALDVPEGVMPWQTAQAALWDCGLLDQVISRKEHLEWREVGAKLAEPHVVEFPSYDKPKLKQFVLDYCDGRIYCDHQCPPNLINMVFMPLALGAFTVKGPDEEKGTEADPAWHAMQKLPPHPGDKPSEPDKPEPPEKPAYPEAPAQPVWKVPDPEQVEALRIQDDSPDVEVKGITDLFATGPSRALAEYHETLALENEALAHQHEKAMAEWEAAKAKIDEAHEAALAEHKADLSRWEVECRSLDERQAAWDREEAIHLAASEGFTVTRLQNLGVIYEHLSAAGPRSVNGQPIFFSFHILNQSDWKRAHAAIVRELSRREDMEI